MTDIYSKLLSWHAAHVRSLGHVEFGATVLRMRSKALHDVLAYVATDDRYTVAQLKQLLLDGTFYQVEFRNLWLGTLGRVAALQALEEPDPEIRAEELEFGVACLKHANSKLARTRENQQFHRLEIELLASGSLTNEARELLKQNEFLSDFFYGYLHSDLENPVISRRSDTYDRWIKGFNKPFTENGLLPIRLCSSGDPRFNALETVPAVPITEGPKVSVLMTSFRPNRDDFLTAVNSILKQSWRNLELIIVDDASPDEFNAVLDEVENLDSRVRVMRLEQNGGTYRARNVGMAAATGVFITGQDSDDWSHPERIAAQVKYLLENPSIPGVIVEAIRADESLVRTFPGRIPHGPCEVSLMLETKLGREVGGYLNARKGADGEFRRRIEKYAGMKVQALEKPLYLIRIGHDSLSRADFKPGWAHPVRRAFWSSSRHWHDNTPAAQLRLPPEGAEPIPIPNRFKVTPQVNPPEYDFIYVGDWRAYTSTQRAMIDEIVALRGEGMTIGILHLESILSPTKETSRMCHEIQALINAGEVDIVVPDENVSARTAVLHDPAILQFASLEGVAVTMELLIIKPDLPPPAVSTAETIYLPVDCEKTAQRLFSSQVVWASNDPEILRLLRAWKPNIVVDRKPFPVAFRSDLWFHTRRNIDTEHPKIGRHSANFEAHWPKDLVTSQSLWPPDGSIEIEILGDPRSYLRKFKLPRVPLSWVTFREQEIRPQAFMSSLNFFIYYPEEDYPQGFCREALEAAAAGAIVMLPHSFREAHGNSAIYGEVDEILEARDYFWSNPSAYEERVRLSRDSLDEISSNELFLKHLKHLSAGSSSSIGQGTK